MMNNIEKVKLYFVNRRISKFEREYHLDECKLNSSIAGEMEASRIWVEKYRKVYSTLIEKREKLFSKLNPEPLGEAI